MPKPVYQKRHRLPEAAYHGQVTISITACVYDRKRLFLDPDVVNSFIDQLKKNAEKHGSIIPIYCFMPDHLHLLVHGETKASRPKTAIEEFKQESGMWLAREMPNFQWQHRFHDHIVRTSEDWKTKARYIANNPVRARLCKDAKDHPFTGALGLDLHDVLYDANR